jgi:hypothetical protein
MTRWWLVAANDELSAYPQAYEQSWLYTELQQTRNFKNWFKKGPLIGKLMTGIEQWALPKIGVDNPPWTLHRDKPDHVYLRPAAEMPQISYPKPDGHADVRSLEQCVCQQHQPRRAAACAPDLEGCECAGEDQPGKVCGARSALLPGWGVRVREQGRCGSAGDQRAELCALQDV